MPQSYSFFLNPTTSKLLYFLKKHHYYCIRYTILTTFA